MPRIARVCALNYPHHITQRGNNRGLVFFEDEDREFYLEILCKYSRKWDLDIWAYCLMSNHVHILSVPRKQESLSRGLGVTNLIYTQYINRKYKRSGRLWQNRFFSTIIDKESYLWAAARYIERNPVRAKLVAKAEDYPWSSARAHISGVTDNVLSDYGWLQTRERDAYDVPIVTIVTLFPHTIIEHERLLLPDLYHYEIAVLWVKYKVEFMRNDY